MDYSKIKYKIEKETLQQEVLSGKVEIETLLEALKKPEVNDKASWVFSSVVELKPDIIKEQDITLLIKLLENNPSKALERNIWRTFQFIEIPINLQEQCTHLAFETLERNESSIAVQVFSMSVAFELSKNNKDLMHLLKEILLFKFENASKGFQSRARKILKEID
ncbi:hypothetical protein [Marivirga arenosa]|uniref:Uncharacterized protein n=1 Tax=Marivirga arenosa TaxID=3059076 RepID=A0AA49GED8_9BACT|nr:hypothetical protein [Marivirga sp. BKB1-2]WKK82067.2 hypothetical protein QYS47_07935 [Marivirga sp. BKB1-2]